MEITFKKIAEMNVVELSNLDLFYNYVCELPLSINTKNYSENEIACIIFGGDLIETGKIIGILLFGERKQTKEESAKFGNQKLFLITRMDVREESRNKKIGQRMLAETMLHIGRIMKCPHYLLKIEKATLKDAPKKYGFEEIGVNYFYKEIK